MDIFRAKFGFFGRVPRDPEDQEVKLPQLATLTLRGYSVNLSRYLEASYDDISLASKEIPPLMEWINECLQDYREQHSVLKAELEEAEAAAYFDLTGPNGFEQNYHGRATADALSKAVCLDPRVKELKRDLAVLAAWCQRLAGVQGTLQAKLDLTRSVESTRRTIFGKE